MTEIGAALWPATLAGLAAAALVGPPRRRRSWQGRFDAKDSRPVGRIGDEVDLPWRAVARLPPRTRVLVGVVLAVSIATLAWRLGVSGLAGGATGVLLGVGVALFLGIVEPAARQRRLAQLQRQTPAALDLLAACLRAGLPLRRAATAVAEVIGGPLADDLGTVTGAVAIGLSDAQAWRLLHDHPTLGPVAVDLVRTVDSGTRLVEALQVHADDARQRHHGAVEAAARALGVRCVLPMMGCFIPAFLLLGIVPTIVSAFAAVIPEVMAR